LLAHRVVCAERDHDKVRLRVIRQTARVLLERIQRGPSDTGLDGRATADNGKISHLNVTVANKKIRWPAGTWL
jgi:hypothetical protein